MKNNLYFLKPIPKTALWGGFRLQQYLKEPAPFDKISELWTLSVRPQDQSIIEQGEYAGETLASRGIQQPFPLLIKLIDARDKLSVQVHPDDALAASEGDQGKTEAWYVMDAEPGAELIFGLKPGLTKKDLENAMEQGTIGEVLHHQPVKKGELYFIPAGTIHGIGAGILIAEIQQNSDITYRLYDYDRTDDQGNKRPLHREKGLEAVKLLSQTEQRAIRFARGEKGLVNCPYFYVGEEQAPYRNRAEKFVILLATEGEGAVNGQPFRAGKCCYITGDFEVTGSIKFLEIKE